MMRLHLPVTVILVFLFLAGCQQSTTSVPAARPSTSSSVEENDNSSRGSTAAADILTPKIATATIGAGELADYLNIKGWAFEYSGHLAQVWVEIEEDGNKSFIPTQPEDHPNLKSSPSADRNPSGKIVFWIKPNSIALRVYGGYPGSYEKGVPADALWWGWKSYGLVITLPGETEKRPLSPQPGEEVTLLRCEAIDDEKGADSSNGLRKVTVLLKAKFAEAR